MSALHSRLFPPLCHIPCKKRIPTYTRTRFGVLYERCMATAVIPYRPNHQLPVNSYYFPMILSAAPMTARTACSKVSAPWKYMM